MRRGLIITLSLGTALILTMVGIGSYGRPVPMGNNAPWLYQYDPPEFEMRDGTMRWYQLGTRNRRGTTVPPRFDGRLGNLASPSRWMPGGYGDVLVEREFRTRWQGKSKHVEESIAVVDCAYVNIWVLVLLCLVPAWWASGLKVGDVFDPHQTIAKFRRRKSERLLARGVCPDCRYDLTGNESGVCPECGRAVVISRLRKYVVPPARLRG